MATPGVAFMCGCGQTLVEGKADLIANMDGGPPALRTVFSCATCTKTYSRWVQRPIGREPREGEERVIWIPEEPRAGPGVPF